MKDTHIASGSFAVTIQTTLYMNDCVAQGVGDQAAKDYLVEQVTKWARDTQFMGSFDDYDEVSVLKIEVEDPGKYGGKHNPVWYEVHQGGRSLIKVEVIDWTDAGEA